MDDSSGILGSNIFDEWNGPLFDTAEWWDMRREVLYSHLIQDRLDKNQRSTIRSVGEASDEYDREGQHDFRALDESRQMHPQCQWWMRFKTRIWIIQGSNFYNIPNQKLTDPSMARMRLPDCGVKISGTSRKCRKHASFYVKTPSLWNKRSLKSGRSFLLKASSR